VAAAAPRRTPPMPAPLVPRASAASAARSVARSMWMLFRCSRCGTLRLAQVVWCITARNSSFGPEAIVRP